MNDAARRKKLDQIATRAAALSMALGHVHAPTGTTVLDRIRQAEPGVRAASYDGARRSGGVTDPTGRTAADTGAERRPDPTAGALRELDQMVTAMFDAEDRISRLLAGYGPPRTANDADRLALARENARAIPGCESCGRVKDPDDEKQDWWQEIDPRLPDGTVVADRATGVPRLDKPMLLCSWCYDFVRRRWRLPTVREVEGRRDGRKLMMPADEEQQVAIRISVRTAEHARALADAQAAYDTTCCG